MSIMASIMLREEVMHDGEDRNGERRDKRRALNDWTHVEQLGVTRSAALRVWGAGKGGNRRTQYSIYTEHHNIKWDHEDISSKTFSPSIVRVWVEQQHPNPTFFISPSTYSY